MTDVVNKQKHERTSMPGLVCQSPGVGKGIEGISCIWCYLVKEGAKKAYSGIRRLSAGKSK